MPLGQQGIVLQPVRAGLEEWRNALDRQYHYTLRFLFVRIGSLVAAILFLLLASALWQRAIFRYVHDPRRRRQFMVAKRIIVGLGMVLILALGFLSSFTSVVTALGFITAGLALALQNVILSVVAYFFLVGRYGLRAGDRVTVSGVTGQVMEVGLVRLFLMELSGTGNDLHPTGRVAAFANSIIFQPSALMKQAPGMDYVWHSASAHRRRLRRSWQEPRASGQAPSSTSITSTGPLSSSSTPRSSAAPTCKPVCPGR